MELMELNQEVETIAYMMKRLLCADVTVVDKHLNSLVNTFEYEKKPIDVQVNSVVGSVIVTGEVRVVEDKREFEECIRCPQFEECEIKSIVGVPIKSFSECIGVIAILTKRETKESGKEFLNNAVCFLEKAAQMLGTKISNQDYKKRLEKQPALINELLNYMKEAVAYVDEQKRLLFFNRRFQDVFRKGAPEIGKNIEAVFDEASHKKRQGEQGYSVGAVFQKPTNGSVKLTFVQNMKEVEGQENYLYVFEDVCVEMIQRRQSKMYDLKQWIEEEFGIAPCMREAKQIALRAIDNELSILIEGKQKRRNDELAKRYLFRYAADGKGMLEIECGEDETIVRQELFGGILRSCSGVEMAKGRAICLYSIDQLPLYLQNRLAEYLTKNQMQGRVGSSIRVIATAKQNVKELMDRKLFSDKLFYYITRNWIRILEAEEPQDIRCYIEQYIAGYANIYNKTGIKVKEEALSYLETCRWEDGIYSLKRFAELLVIEQNGAIITLDNVKRVQFKYGYKGLGGTDDEQEERVRELLLYSGKTKKEIAKELGIGRATLYRWLEKYNL